MRGKIEAVIFDWAGTVVDYGSFAPVEAFRRAFAEAGVQPTTEEIRRPMGLSKRLHVQKMFEMPRIADQWLQIQFTIMGSIRAGLWILVFIIGIPLCVYWNTAFNMISQPRPEDLPPESEKPEE